MNSLMLGSRNDILLCKSRHSLAAWFDYCPVSRRLRILARRRPSFKSFFGLIVGGFLVANCSGNVAERLDPHYGTAFNARVLHNLDAYPVGKPHSVTSGSKVREAADHYPVRPTARHDHNSTSALSLYARVTPNSTVPKLDATASCRGTRLMAKPTDADAETKRCVEAEHRARNWLVQYWPKFSDNARTRCTNVTEIYAPNYIELLTCLELTQHDPNTYQGVIAKSW